MKRVIIILFAVTIIMSCVSVHIYADSVEGTETVEMDGVVSTAKDVTLRDRLLEFATAENISSTLGSVCTVVCSIAIFVFRKIQKKDYDGNARGISHLKKELAAEREANIRLREDVDRLICSLDENTSILKKINIDTDENKLMLDTTKKATAATAKMVLDAFGHSRTIDSATKELITLEYLQVISPKEEGGEDSGEQQSQI